MKKEMRKAKRFAALALASALIFSSTIPFSAQGVQATLNSNAAVTTNAMTGQELAVLVNPIVQQYTVDDSQQTWVMTEDSRLAVMATQENLENERLAEVVELVNSEFMEKQVVFCESLCYGICQCRGCRTC